MLLGGFLYSEMGMNNSYDNIPLPVFRERYCMEDSSTSLHQANFVLTGQELSGWQENSQLQGCNHLHL